MLSLPALDLTRAMLIPFGVTKLPHLFASDGSLFRYKKMRHLITLCLPVGWDIKEDR